MSFTMYHMDFENGKVYVEEDGRLLYDYEVMAKSRKNIKNNINETDEDMQLVPVPAEMEARKHKKHHIQVRSRA